MPLRFCQRRSKAPPPALERLRPSAPVHAHLFERRYFQNKQGYWLHYRRWDPPAWNSHQLFVVHGYAEHCGRYDNVALAFTNQGYRVYALDLLGHGASEGERRVLHDLNHVVGDVAQLVELAAEQYPRSRYGQNFLVGHSMGGLLVVAAVLKRPNLKIDGVLLSAPLLGAAGGMRWLGAFGGLAKTLAATFPTFEVPTGIEVEKLCRSKSVTEHARRDPLMGSAATAPLSMVSVVLDAMAYVEEQQARFSLPVFVQYGTADRVISHEAIDGFLAEIASRVKKGRALPGWAHEIFLECEADCGVDGDSGWTTNDAVSAALAWTNTRAFSKSLDWTDEIFLEPEADCGVDDGSQYLANRK